MKRDFPANERPPFSAIRRNFKTHVYEGYFLTYSGADAGYAIVIAPEGNECALLLYFAIFPEMRGNGCGSGFLKIICERYNGRSIVLEVEDPAAANTEEKRLQTERRVRFYERAGFSMLPSSRVKIFGVDMRIMTNSNNFSGSLRELMHSLYLPAFTSKKWLRFIDVED